MIIYYQRNRFKGMGTVNKIKEKIANIKNPTLPRKELDYYELDHIIPYCISADSSMENLQLLPIREHQIKTGTDQKIVFELIRKGIIEKVFTYMNLLADQKLVIEEYKLLFEKYSKEKERKEWKPKFVQIVD